MKQMLSFSTNLVNGKETVKFHPVKVVQTKAKKAADEPKCYFERALLC